MKKTEMKALIAERSQYIAKPLTPERKFTQLLGVARAAYRFKTVGWYVVHHTHEEALERVPKSLKVWARSKLLTLTEEEIAAVMQRLKAELGSLPG